MVYRVFVEKKEGLDVKAAQLLKDIRLNLSLITVKKIRVFNRYDVEGVSPEQFEQACREVFSETPVDNFYVDQPPCNIDFTIEYLPGQYDQRADSARQCIQLITMGELPEIRSAVAYSISSASPEDMECIKKYMINPVDSREASPEIPETLIAQITPPKRVKVLRGFRTKYGTALTSLCAEYGLAMNEADLVLCRKYFQSLERDPTITELRVIDTYWSDHCRHTTFSTELTSVLFDGAGSVNKMLKSALREYHDLRDEYYGEEKPPVTLMDMATIAAKTLKKRGALPELDVSPEINACSINVTVKTDKGNEKQLVQFKNETHNHPTEIEPFGGAATCLGGAIRDPLSGRAYVYQAMRVTGCSDPTLPEYETLEGKLSQRRLTTGAAAGYSSYGNQIGLATGLVREHYHPGYVAKRLEIGAVIGSVEKKNVRREEPAPGDIVLLIGGATGRDGIGGATGSSKAHDVNSIETCGAEVQKGNPITERKLQRLFRNANFSLLVKRCNDFGAGGVCVAIGELADGVRVNLDAVPKKYDGLDGTELAISESQERMAVVVDAKDCDKAIELARAENLEAVKVAKITQEPVLAMYWNGKRIVSLDRSFLDTNGAPQSSPAVVVQPKLNHNRLKRHLFVKRDQLIDALAKLEHCSQRGLGEMFDGTIGSRSVLMPFGGVYQLTPAQAMASLIPAKSQSHTATVMAYGFEPAFSEQSPFLGAEFAVTQSLARLVASGADYKKAYLTFQEYFQRMTKNPAVWGEPAAALLGALHAQMQFGRPAIGGKDSMSGSFGKLHVPPTFVSFAVAPVEAKYVVSNEFKGEGHRVVFFEPRLITCHSMDYDKTKLVFERVTALLRSGNALSACAVDTLFVSVAKCCMGNGVGFEFLKNDELLDIKPGGIIVELAPDAPMPEDAELLGETTLEAAITIPEFEPMMLSEIVPPFELTLDDVFPNFVPAPSKTATDRLWTNPPVKPHSSASRIAKPRVLIPVFPGTNCEDDTARAFEKAGAKVETLLIKNLCPADVSESAKRLVSALNSAQMLALPGGFSGGDEPDGSAKLIVAMFKNPRVAEALTRLLDDREGLVLGICNGFQALVKLGLLPYGRITPRTDSSPTLYYNTIGRHVSRIVRTRVASTLSPWLSACSAGDVFNVPVSHGEGRFVATEEEIAGLFESGQVATQYVDLTGRPKMDFDFNPNGSMHAIEGITSPDGRVLGRMGHSERTGEYLYKNVPGNYDQQIFLSGVKYFS